MPMHAHSCPLPAVKSMYFLPDQCPRLSSTTYYQGYLITLRKVIKYPYYARKQYYSVFILRVLSYIQCKQSWCLLVFFAEFRCFTTPSTSGSAYVMGTPQLR